MSETKASKLLSAYLREIGSEVTEVIKDPDSGIDRMATKAEKLARLIWQDALGYKEMETKNGKLVDIYHQPNRTAQTLILDRLEGRSPLATETGGKRITAADKVTEAGKKRINSIRKEENDKGLQSL